MQTLPPISTVTNSSKEKYIIIQTNGNATTSIETINSPPRIVTVNQPNSNCQSQSDITHYPTENNKNNNNANNRNNNIYHRSPIRASGSNNTRSNNNPTNYTQPYSVNIKYEYDVKLDDEIPSEKLQQNLNESDKHSGDASNSESGSSNGSIGTQKLNHNFITVPYTTSNNCQLTQPKLEKVIYTSNNSFDTYNGDIFDGMSILEDEKMRVSIIVFR